MKKPRLLSSVFVLLLGTLLTASCDRDKSQLVGGEVVEDSLVAYRALDYELTSEKYRQWLQAESALDSATVDARVRVNTRRLTDEDIDKAVAALEAQQNARSAIERSGLSVRDYVLTTIALAQSWDALNRPSSRSASVPGRNVEFLRLQAATDTGLRTRPRARVLDDSDSDSEDDDSERSNRKGRSRGQDSDSDSN